MNEGFISLREYKENQMAKAALCDTGIKKKIPIYVISSNTCQLIPLTPFQINEIICAYPKLVKTHLEETNGSDNLNDAQELSCIKLWVKKSDA